MKRLEPLLLEAGQVCVVVVVVVVVRTFDTRSSVSVGRVGEG